MAGVLASIGVNVDDGDGLTAGIAPQAIAPKRQMAIMRTRAIIFMFTHTISEAFGTFPY
jgi:hypothetical protein